MQLLLLPEGPGSYTAESFSFPICSMRVKLSTPQGFEEESSCIYASVGVPPFGSFLRNAGFVPTEALPPNLFARVLLFPIFSLVTRGRQKPFPGLGCLLSHLANPKLYFFVPADPLSGQQLSCLSQASVK